MSSHSRADLLRYKIAPKYPLSGPFHHSGLRRNPEVAGRFVAIISFLHTPVRGGNICANTQRAKTASSAVSTAACAAGAPVVSVAGIGLSNAK